MMKTIDSYLNRIPAQIVPGQLPLARIDRLEDANLCTGLHRSCNYY
jgi:hypothetical protein